MFIIIFYLFSLISLSLFFQLLRFLNRIAQHPVLQTDPSFVKFLQLEGDLPKATSTAALSGAGFMRLISRVEDSIGRIAYKLQICFDETDSVRLFLFILFIDDS